MPPRRPEQPRRPSFASRVRLLLPEIAAAFVAFALVAADLDPSGTYDWLPDGPGLTVDESFNVEQGVRLEIGSRYLLLGAVSLRELFGTAAELGPQAPIGYHLADHPPLGRYLLGAAHDLVTGVAMPADWPTPFVTAAARFGSVVAFAATVLLVGCFGTRRYGRVGGLVAAAGLVCMPRVFGHAHFASLETMIGLFYAATVLFIADRWEFGSPIRRSAAMMGGLLFGLALLAKVQAVLLPIPIAAWALWHWRGKAVVPLALFGAVGALVFFTGWPWLWFDPIDNVLQYLGRTTDRISLPVWYMNRVFADRDVPWHYPFVMFAVTVPVGLHALGAIGVAAGWRDPAQRLVLACLAFPLLVFAVPGIAVYDGARLFLVSFPLWAALVGRGGTVAHRWLSARANPRIARIVLVLFLASQSWGIISYRPTYVSYYNLLVGGLAGAERLGFEPTYWGDAMTARLIQEGTAKLPEGATIAVAPVLHQFQLDDLLAQSPVLRQRGIRLVEYQDGNDWDEDPDGPAAVLVFFRKASLSERVRSGRDFDPIATVRRKGVVLAGLYRISRDLD